jgi:hypothetical protein
MAYDLPNRFKLSSATLAPPRVLNEIDVRLEMAHLLEAEARVQDLLWLEIWRKAGASRSVVDRLQKQLMTEALYNKVLRYYCERTSAKLGTPQVVESLLIFIHLAMWPSIGLDRPKAPIAVDDLTPTFRFLRLVECSSRIKPPLSPLDSYHEYVNQLCECCGWETPLEIGRRIRRSFDPKDANRPERDLFNRLFAFLDFVERRKTLPVFYHRDAAFSMATAPWLAGINNTLEAKNLPEGMIELEMWHFVLGTCLLESLAFTSSIETARNWHSRFWSIAPKAIASNEEPHFRFIFERTTHFPLEALP